MLENTGEALQLISMKNASKISRNASYLVSSYIQKAKNDTFASTCVSRATVWNHCQGVSWWSPHEPVFTCACHGMWQSYLLQAEWPHTATQEAPLVIHEQGCNNHDVHKATCSRIQHNTMSEPLYIHDSFDKDLIVGGRNSFKGYSHPLLVVLEQGDLPSIAARWGTYRLQYWIACGC